MPPRSAAVRPPRAPAGIAVRRLARERGVTVHQVLMAIARGELRVRRPSARVLVTAASAAAWRPRGAARPASPTAHAPAA